MSQPIDDLDAPPPRAIAFGLWRRVLQVALGHRRALVGLVGGGLFIAALESVRPMVNAAMIDEATAHGITPRFWWIAGLWGAMGLGFGVGVWTFIRGAGRLSAGLAYDLGFADQAHLTREFRALAHMTPRTFREYARQMAHRHDALQDTGLYARSAAPARP